MTWTRRRFISAGAAFCGASACGLGCNGASPDSSCAASSSGTDDPYCLIDPIVVRVTGAARLVAGEAILTNVDDATAVIVARDADGFHALSAICTHACCVVALCGNLDCSALSVTPGACGETPIASGNADAASVLCPCHGSTFRLRDGAALTGPATTPLPSFAIQFDGDDALVDTAVRVPSSLRV